MNINDNRLTEDNNTNNTSNVINNTNNKANISNESYKEKSYEKLIENTGK